MDAGRSVKWSWTVRQSSPRLPEGLVCSASECGHELWDLAHICKLAAHNLQTAHAAEYQKHKQLNQKIGRSPKWTFLQRRHIDGQEVHEKTINVSNYQRNANWIYNEVPPHISQNGHHQSPQTINAGKGMEKKEPFCTINESVNWCSHYGEQYRGKNRATMNVCMLSHFSRVWLFATLWAM